MTEVASGPAAALREPTNTADQSRRAVVSGALGSVMEWFDFAVYGSLSATVFPKLFFSQLGDTAGLLASFATFGVGFAARPLGGVVFGHLGDRIGRRPVLLSTFIIMGLASTLIGLLPGGQSAVFAGVLVALRFIQGFSLGGELTGSQLMAMEHSDPKRRGLAGSLMTMGSPLANLVANIVLVVLSASLAESQWEAWGWRIPFLASLLLVAVGIYIRLRLHETPAFEAAKDEVAGAPRERKQSGLVVFRQQPVRIIQLIFVFGGIAITYNLLTTYGISYMVAHGANSSRAFVSLMIANGVAFVCCILGGVVSDSIGRKNVFLIGTGGCLVGVLLFFPLAGAGSFIGGTIALIIAACGVQFAFGAQPAMYAEQFPTQTRFAGSAMSYTISNLIFAAPAPLVATALTAVSGGSSVPITLLMVAVLIITAIALFTLKDRAHVDLTAYATIADERKQLA